MITRVLIDERHASLSVGTSEAAISSFVGNGPAEEGPRPSSWRSGGTASVSQFARSTWVTLTGGAFFATLLTQQYNTLASESERQMDDPRQEKRREIRAGCFLLLMPALLIWRAAADSASPLRWAVVILLSLIVGAIALQMFRPSKEDPNESDNMAYFDFFARIDPAALSEKSGCLAAGVPTA